MKKLFFLSTVLSILLCCYSQETVSRTIKRDPAKGQLVKINNWNKVAVLYSAKEFFRYDKDEIIQQIGEEEFTEVTLKGQANSWPGKHKFYDPRIPGFMERLDKLKLYKIATFNHKNANKEFGNYVILRIPYKDNENWDKDITWEGNVYMIIPEKYTGIIDLTKRDIEENTEKKNLVKGKPVKINNWDGLTVVYSIDGFVEDQRDDIIKQIGEQEFKTFKSKGQPCVWPDGGKFYNPKTVGYAEKLNKLRLYKIASYTPPTFAKEQGNYLIIRVPYKENENWDKIIQWEGNFYITIPEKYTEIVK